MWYRPGMALQIYMHIYNIIIIYMHQWVNLNMTNGGNELWFIACNCKWEYCSPWQTSERCDTLYPANASMGPRSACTTVHHMWKANCHINRSSNNSLIISWIWSVSIKMWILLPIFCLTKTLLSCTEKHLCGWTGCMTNIDYYALTETWFSERL